MIHFCVLTQAYYVFAVLTVWDDAQKKLQKGKLNWRDSVPRSPRLSLNSVVPLFTSEQQQDQIFRFTGSSSSSSTLESSPAMRHLTSSCFEVLSQLEQQLDVPSNHRSRALYGLGPQSLGLSSSAANPSPLYVSLTLKRIASFVGGKNDHKFVSIQGPIAIVFNSSTTREDHEQDRQPERSIELPDIMEAVSAINTEFSAYPAKNVLATGVPTFLVNSLRQTLSPMSRAAKRRLSPSKTVRIRNSGTGVADLRYKFTNHSVMLQLLLLYCNTNGAITGSTSSASTGSSSSSSSNHLPAGDPVSVWNSAVVQGWASDTEPKNISQRFLNQLTGADATKAVSLSSLKRGNGNADDEVVSALALMDIYESNLANIYRGIAQVNANAEGHGVRTGPLMKSRSRSGIKQNKYMH